MLKGERAAVSAKLLLEAGDLDGACNRAYYAMFDAARAALLVSDAPIESEVARTHSGLIAAFTCTGSSQGVFRSNWGVR